MLAQLEVSRDVRLTGGSGSVSRALFLVLGFVSTMLVGVAVLGALPHAQSPSNDAPGLAFAPTSMGVAPARYGNPTAGSTYSGFTPQMPPQAMASSGRPARATPSTMGLKFWKNWGRATAPSMTATAEGATLKENHLEYEPYHDMSKIPVNTFKPKDPFEGKIVSVTKIVGPKSTGETYDVVIDHEGNMPYVEGQSYGVLAPGEDAKGKAHRVRLYSIASSRYGDDQTGKTTTLCVRRATYWCPELQAEDPAKKGVCSNYLCDAKAGDTIKLTGPTGKAMLLPEDKPETDIIMVATGTGIAPMRSFIKRIFVDETPYARDFKGLAWLFLGVANTDALLYDDDWKKIASENPDKFRYDVALSREQKNKNGDKMYIQDKVEEYADEIFERLDKGAHIYFCGLKGMMPGIQEMLARVAEKKGLSYDEFTSKLKKNGQWHVEVY